MSLIFFFKPIFRGSGYDLAPEKRRRKKVYRIIKKEHQIHAEPASFKDIAEGLVEEVAARVVAKRRKRIRQITAMMEFMEEY